MEGLGIRTPLCGKCDVTFSYIYTNTTKLLVIALKLTILAEICVKCVNFIAKFQKSPSAEGLASNLPCLRQLQTPIASVAGSSAPIPLDKPPPLRNPGYATVFRYLSKCFYISFVEFIIPLG